MTGTPQIARSGLPGRRLERPTGNAGRIGKDDAREGVSSHSPSSAPPSSSSPRSRAHRLGKRDGSHKDVTRLRSNQQTHIPKCVRRSVATASAGPVVSTCAAAWRPNR
jgi:hypothetical protein